VCDFVATIKLVAVCFVMHAKFLMLLCMVGVCAAFGWLAARLMQYAGVPAYLQCMELITLHTHMQCNTQCFAASASTLWFNQQHNGYAVTCWGSSYNYLLLLASFGANQLT
jgi:hypothetical protein